MTGQSTKHIPARRATQLPLPLTDPRWRPLMSLNAVMGALDLTSEEVDELLQLGMLVGFDISVNGQCGSHRRELRLLTKSVDLYRACLGSRQLGWSPEKIIDSLTPHSKPVIAGTEIDRALNCDRDHRLNLIRAGLLVATTIPGTEERITNGIAWRRGNGGEAHVTRQSFEQFLRKRMQ